MTPGTSSDRYEPLPGLLEIPGYLVRKIPPRARKPAAYGAGLLLVAIAVGLALAIPAITDSKQERADAAAQAERERLAQRTAELQAELRLVEGRGTPARGLDGAAALDARHLLVDDVTAAIKADALARVQSGEFTQSINHVECERYPRGARGEDPADALGTATGRYSCLAITAISPRTEGNESSSIGYPYRVLVNFETGRYGLCKISGRPGEGSIARKFPVQLPAECGG